MDGTQNPMDPNSQGGAQPQGQQPPMTQPAGAHPGAAQQGGAQPQGGQQAAQPVVPPVQPAAAVPPVQPAAVVPPVQPAAATPPVQPAAAVPPVQPAQPPMGGAGAAQPAGAQPPAGGAAADPAQPTSDYMFGDVWGEFNTSIKIPPHSLQFEEPRFLRLLAGSISLTKEEKWKIIQYVPKLTQYKVDQLMNILEEEQRKFKELSAQHGDHLKKLEEKHKAEWSDLEYKFEQKDKRNDDADKADEIRKNLGL